MRVNEFVSALNLDDARAYGHWRDWKLEHQAESLADLVVEVADPLQLTTAERSQLLGTCRRCNAAVYVCARIRDEKTTLQHLGRQFGLHTLDHNLGADDAGVTGLEVRQDSLHRRYIPYSNREIHWHTDGYYNRPERSIYAMLLHCVRPAQAGGENLLLDPELLYIRLRDQNPAYIRELSRPDAMYFPENRVAGKLLRSAIEVPVFSLSKNGFLHMRYTQRARNLLWGQGDLLAEARQCIEALLAEQNNGIFKARLEAGMGLLCNNILHTRSAFIDDQDTPRLLYRLRYHERIE